MRDWAREVPPERRILALARWVLGNAPLNTTRFGGLRRASATDELQPQSTAQDEGWGTGREGPNKSPHGAANPATDAPLARVNSARSPAAILLSVENHELNMMFHVKQLRGGQLRGWARGAGQRPVRGRERTLAGRWFRRATARRDGLRSAV